MSRSVKGGVDVMCLCTCGDVGYGKLLRGLSTHVVLKGGGYDWSGCESEYSSVCRLMVDC